MTALTRVVSRVTLRPESRDAGRAIIVSLVPGDLLTFRLARGRKTWTLPVSAAYSLAIKLAVAAEAKANPKRRR